MKNIVTSIRLLALCLALVNTTLAGTLDLPIVTDTYLDSRSSNTGRNYGAATTVRSLVNSSDGSVCRGLFKLPPEAGLFSADQIAEAQVRFYVWQDNTTNRNITLYPLSRAFVEGTGNGTAPADGATWNTWDGTNAWTTPGGDFDATHPVVGQKGDVLDAGLNDRFFIWDIRALLTNETTRAALLDHGALLQIDEVPLPASGSPRAPFTSSDDVGYTPTYRPHLRLLVVPQTVNVTRVAIENNAVVMDLTNGTPLVTNRLERSFDLRQPDGWTLVTEWVATGSATNWSEAIQPEWTNVYYRITEGP